MQSESIRILHEGAVAFYPNGSVAAYDPDCLLRPFVVINPDEFSIAGIVKVLATGFYRRFFCSALKVDDFIPGHLAGGREQDAPGGLTEEDYFRQLYNHSGQLFTAFRRCRRDSVLEADYDRLARDHNPEKIFAAIASKFPQGLGTPLYAARLPEFATAVNSLPEYMRSGHARNFLHLAVPAEINQTPSLRELATEEVARQLIIHWGFGNNNGLSVACMIDMESAAQIFETYRAAIGKVNASNEPVDLLAELFSMEQNSLVAIEEIATRLPHIFPYYHHIAECLEKKSHCVVQGHNRLDLMSYRAGSVVKADAAVFRATSSTVSGNERGERVIIEVSFRSS